MYTIDIVITTQVHIYLGCIGLHTTWILFEQESCYRKNTRYSLHPTTSQSIKANKTFYFLFIYLLVWHITSCYWLFSNTWEPITYLLRLKTFLAKIPGYLVTYTSCHRTSVSLGNFKTERTNLMPPNQQPVTSITSRVFHWCFHVSRIVRNFFTIPIIQIGRSKEARSRRNVELLTAKPIMIF